MAPTSEDKPGQQLERLVAMLERALATTGARIEAPSRRLIDRDTGRPREHDVLITWDHGHHQIVTAIECRDRSRPVGVPAVEAFADKCTSTGVNSGVIVSARGFHNSARVKAASRSITCMDIEEVARFDWLGTEAFIRYERQFGVVNFAVMFDGARPDEVAAIFDTFGNEVSADSIMSTAVHSVPHSDDPDQEVGKLNSVQVRMNTQNWTARDLSGAEWPISYIVASTEFTTVRSATPMMAHRYTGGGRDYSIRPAPVNPVGHNDRPDDAEKHLLGNAVAAATGCNTARLHRLADDPQYASSAKQRRHDDQHIL